MSYDKDMIKTAKQYGYQSAIVDIMQILIDLDLHTVRISNKFDDAKNRFMENCDEPL